MRLAMMGRLPLTSVTPPLFDTASLRLDVPLAEHTTLRVGGPAARFVTATQASELVDVVATTNQSGEPLLVLGGGSNLVVGDAGFPGTVLKVANLGRRIDRIGDGLVQLTVEAGEQWDDVVADTVEQGLGGLECLSGIPGLVGATPVQNVGAYGVEISELLTSVDLLDRATARVHQVPAAELGLAYRTSVLKGTDSAVVLRVRFTLRGDERSVPIRYAELARTLGVDPQARVPAAAARAAVLELRRGKGMVLDPADHDTWSAGSFFTNPIIDNAQLEAVQLRAAELLGADVPMPTYPADSDHTKLSAGWLIERAGFPKGHLGAGQRAGLSTRHTLALTNRGSATAVDVLDLAREVREGVHARFGVTLKPEPVLVNCEF
ncbi:UDP-N-acetylmuramate dehydrogenase [Pseudonocardiaceae bacterium YIM PH 21723]|nr:UDP-N-acetylmuramate dehydrogenase [Pseudonocardiaceae bacterium YIM PH 21723]